MTRVLRSVLNSSDLPLAELCAAKLDGEVYSVDECFAAIDEVNTPLIRAIAVASIAPRSVIAELATAAWILGVEGGPPEQHRFVVDAATRIRTERSSRFIIRECVIKQGDVATIGGFDVTTPVRTVVDLLRTSRRFTDEEQRAVVELMSMHELTYPVCSARLDSQPNVPGTRRARERLGFVAAVNRAA
jgi:hypothetical protein